MFYKNRTKISILIIITIFILSLAAYAYAESYGRYGINTDDNTENIVDFIIEEASKNVPIITDTYAVDLDGNPTFIPYRNFTFKDDERDYSNISFEEKLSDDFPKELMNPKINTLKVQYEHDPTIFDEENAETRHPKGDSSWNIINSINDDFLIHEAFKEHRGKWKMKIKASDDTKNPDWDKYSDEFVLEFTIHAKPKAIINQYKPETEAYIFLSANESYDLDFEYSKSNKGIVKYLWEYQLEDGSWHTYSEDKFVTLPKIIGGQRVVNYSLTVYDCYNEKDITIASILPPKITPIVPEINANIHPEFSKYIVDEKIVIPSTESLKVLDIFTRSINTVEKIEFSLYSVLARKSPLITLSNPENIISSDGIETYWRDIRNYKVPGRDIHNQYLRDGNYIAKVKGIDGTDDLEKEWQIQINTPVELNTDVPNKFQAETVVTIKATTSKYVENLTIILYKDTPFEKTIKNPTVTSKITGENIEWQYIYEVPTKILDGEYIAEIKAVTYNGESETKQEIFRIQNLKLENLRITHLVNHPQHEGKYPILFTEALVDYKTGYYVTFKIDAQGDPDTVKMRISYPGYSEEFDMIMESRNGSDSVWKLEWYSDPFVKKGTIINTKVTAQKGETTVNFNDKYGWDGDYLIVIGSIENDVRIDQEF